MNKLSIIAIVTCFSNAAFAAGFLINEHGAGSSGRANAFVAKANDGSAIFHNPAGITQLEGFSGYVGVNMIAPRSEFTTTTDPVTTTRSKAQEFFPPNAYLAYKVNPLLTVGLGFNMPFGLSMEWGPESPGRTIIREQVLRTMFISPVAAFDLNEYVPGLSVAAGPDLVPASVYLRRDIIFGSEVGMVELSGRTMGIGGRAGVLYKLPQVEGLSFGLTYRSPVTLDIDGDADFTMADPFRASLAPDGPGKTSLTLPQSVLAGVGYTYVLNDEMSFDVEFDVNYIGWSSYDELEITLADDSVSVADKSWEDTWVLRAGGEFRYQDYAVRLGYARDPTPVPATTLDPTLPDGDRNLLTGGLGAKFGNYRADLAAVWVMPTTQQTADELGKPPIKAEYEVSAWVVSLNVGFALFVPEDSEDSYDE